MFNTGDGFQVVLGDHVSDHGTSALVAEAIGQVRADGRSFFLAEVNLGRTIGRNACVPCPPNADGVYYARRGDRAFHTRMVAGVESPECSTLVLVVGKSDDSHVVYTAYVGTIAPREPWDPGVQNDPSLLQESREFWSRHALVDDGSTILTVSNGAPSEWSWMG